MCVSVLIKSLTLSGSSSWLAFCPLNRPCVLMCSEARGEEATAGTLQCRPSEIVAAPKVRQNTCAYGSMRGKQGCLRDADAMWSWFPGSKKPSLFFCIFYLEWTLACLCKSFNIKIWFNFDWVNFDWENHHPHLAKSTFVTCNYRTKEVVNNTKAKVFHC